MSYLVARRKIEGSRALGRRFFDNCYALRALFPLSLDIFPIMAALAMLLNEASIMMSF